MLKGNFDTVEYPRIWMKAETEQLDRKEPTYNDDNQPIRTNTGPTLQLSKVGMEPKLDTQLRQ